MGFMNTDDVMTESIVIKIEEQKIENLGSLEDFKNDEAFKEEPETIQN